MEERKIIKFGNSSYVLTLPNNWIEKHSLTKGDLVYVTENEDMLYISLDKKKEDKKAKINFDGKPLKIFRREVISFYLKNYKYIEIEGKDLTTYLSEIRILLEKLSSLEIVEITDNRVLLKDLSNPSEFDLEEIIDEIIELGKSHFNELVKTKSNNKEYFLSNLDININKLSFLAYKAINSNLDKLTNPIQSKSSIHYWRIVEAFEHTGDIIKRTARYIKELDEEKLNYINEVIYSVKAYYEFVSGLLKSDSINNMENNLKLNLDKKQSLLKELEMLREKFGDNINLYLVIEKQLKDIIGTLEDVVISVIDLNCSDKR